MISILEMLRDKTEGRRTPEEEEVLEASSTSCAWRTCAMAGAAAA